MKHFVMLGLLLGIIYSAQATRIERGKNIIVINQPVYEDLYVAGSDIVINAPVHGDLVMGGGTVTINDECVGLHCFWFHITECKLAQKQAIPSGF